MKRKWPVFSRREKLLIGGMFTLGSILLFIFFFVLEGGITRWI